MLQIQLEVKCWPQHLHKVGPLSHLWAYCIVGSYSVGDPISVKHWFSYPAVISVITISVSPFNNQIVGISLKIGMSSMCNVIRSRILCNRLCDQRILRLQGCLVELHWRSAACIVAVMKEMQESLLDQALQWSRIELSTLLKYLWRDNVNQTTRHRTVILTAKWLRWNEDI